MGRSATLGAISPWSGLFFERLVGANLHERQLDQQSLMLRASVLDVSLIQHIQSTDKEEQIGPRRLILEFHFDVFCGFHQFQRLWISTYHQIAQVIGPPRDEVMRVESLAMTSLKSSIAPGMSLASAWSVRVKYVS